MKRKGNIVIIVLILVMILAVIGVSYAAFSYSKTGTKVNSITTGSITMSYTESDNVINIDKALPTTDETGKVRLKEGEYFDFTISSEIVGDININYEISAKDVTTSERKIDGSNIKLYLTRLTDAGEEELMTPETYNEESSANSYTGRPSGEMSLYTSSMSSSESNKYRLRMWVDEDYNPQGDGGNLEFSVKINVYGQDRVAEEVSTVLLNNIPVENQYDDGIDTFVTGEDPNNYIWYSGKLWRAVSVNNEAKTTKLVTQWNISAIPYNEGKTTTNSNFNNFNNSYMEKWLNDTTVDGFLGNLRDYEDFIVIDSVWDATMDDTALGSIIRPNGTTTVTDAVGLLTAYEYQSSSGDNASSYNNSYLNNGLYWWTLTPINVNFGGNIRYYIRGVSYSGNMSNVPSLDAGCGVRPSIVLKTGVRIVDGDGTVDNPYRLNGDDDTNLSGTFLNTRYSGEYIKFGNNENNLYRIVSHETKGLTKITSASPLKNNNEFITSTFSTNLDYSDDDPIYIFLNGDYLTSGDYLTAQQVNMIEDTTSWYYGLTDADYRLAKYTDSTMQNLTTSTTISKIGILRLGELMSGQFERYRVKGESSQTNLTTDYLLINTATVNHWKVNDDGSSHNSNVVSFSRGVKPALNLKSNVVITGGEGTRGNPFTIDLAK